MQNVWRPFQVITQLSWEEYLSQNQLINFKNKEANNSREGTFIPVNRSRSKIKDSRNGENEIRNQLWSSARDMRDDAR